jgi:hypothetical protein
MSDGYAYRFWLIHKREGKTYADHVHEIEPGIPLRDVTKARQWHRSAAKFDWVTPGMEDAMVSDLFAYREGREVSVADGVADERGPRRPDPVQQRAIS